VQSGMSWSGVRLGSILAYPQTRDMRWLYLWSTKTSRFAFTRLCDSVLPSECASKCLERRDCKTEVMVSQAYRCNQMSELAYLRASAVPLYDGPQRLLTDP